MVLLIYYLLFIAQFHFGNYIHFQTHFVTEKSLSSLQQHYSTIFALLQKKSEVLVSVVFTQRWEKATEVAFSRLRGPEGLMEFQDSHSKAPQPKFECLLFDVDDTLYPLSSGLSDECTKNIIEYMTDKLNIDAEKVPEMCAELYKEYGTTMAGLRAIGYDFDYDDYHSFVHGRLPYEWLKPDHTLRTLLHSLPIRKVIFSNGNEAHVSKVLSGLGLEDCFDDIICFETLNPPDNDEVPKPLIVCKPFENSFEQAFQIAEIDPKKTLFFDDSIRNLQTAKNMGLHTVWVGSSHRTKGVDYSLESIHNIKEALPELWEALEKSYVHHPEEAAIETYVSA